MTETISNRDAVIPHLIDHSCKFCKSRGGGRGARVAEAFGLVPYSKAYVNCNTTN